MLKITFHVRPRVGGDDVWSGVIYESVDQHPDWLDRLEPPAVHDIIETWSPIAGDPNHMVETTGYVEHRYVNAVAVEQLMGVAGTDAKLAHKQKALDYPDARYYWIVRAESRKFRRVPRTDKNFQKQLAATLNA